MITAGLKGASVLVTGGTRGLGRAIGLEFARVGATVFLTYHWGSEEESDVIAAFRAEGLPAPILVQANASDADATRELMATIKAQTGKLDALINNVAFAKVVRGMDELSKSALDLSLAYSAWPLVEYIQIAHQTFGRYPRYAVGISSFGGEQCFDGYDLAGVSKSVLETLCRYLAYRLKPHGVRVNAIRAWLLDTASLRATFGDELVDTVKARAHDIFMEPQGIARVCVALCSGLLDAVTGQVIVADEGWSLVSPLSYLSGRGLGSEGTS